MDELKTRFQGFTFTRFMALVVVWIFNLISRPILLDGEFTWLWTMISLVQIAGVVVSYELAHLLVLKTLKRYQKKLR